MKLTERKKKLKNKLLSILTTITLIAIKCNNCLAVEGNSSIGTTEVTAATKNIERVIISIAMPLGRCFDFCKCGCSSSKNDCKCKQSTKTSRKY